MGSAKGGSPVASPLESQAGGREKLETLREILLGMDKAIVAFSGGVDSSFLLAVAGKTLGVNHVMAVTAVSEVYSKRETEAAKRLAEELGIAHVLLSTRELEDQRFANNPTNRCLHCKHELFGKMRELAKRHGFQHIADGTTASDLQDHRPGLLALKKYGVRSLLLEAGLTKDEIRACSKKMGLSTWDKPSMSCLAARFPYGSRITAEKLRQVDRAEEFLYQLGFRQVRVRHYDQLARIEVPPEELFSALAHREEITAVLKRLGFRYITLDLEGYRSGSMNEVLRGSRNV